MSKPHESDAIFEGCSRYIVDGLSTIVAIGKRELNSTRERGEKEKKEEKES